MKSRNELSRLTRIAARYAKRFGVSAAVYASASSFDVLCERRDKGKDRGGIYWHTFSIRDVYASPRAVALAIRKDIAAVWQRKAAA
jgi:hypothetical protein